MEQPLAGNVALYHAQMRHPRAQEPPIWVGLGSSQVAEPPDLRGNLADASNERGWLAKMQRTHLSACLLSSRLCCLTCSISLSKTEPVPRPLLLLPFLAPMAAFGSVLVFLGGGCPDKASAKLVPQLRFVACGSRGGDLTIAPLPLPPPLLRAGPWLGPWLAPRGRSAMKLYIWLEAGPDVHAEVDLGLHHKI